MAAPYCNENVRQHGYVPRWLWQSHREVLTGPWDCRATRSSADWRVGHWWTRSVGGFVGDLMVSVNGSWESSFVIAIVTATLSGGEK